MLNGVSGVSFKGLSSIKLQDARSGDVTVRRFDAQSGQYVETTSRRETSIRSPQGSLRQTSERRSAEKDSYVSGYEKDTASSRHKKASKNSSTGVALALLLGVTSVVSAITGVISPKPVVQTYAGEAAVVETVESKEKPVLEFSQESSPSLKAQASVEETPEQDAKKAEMEALELSYEKIVENEDAEAAFFGVSSAMERVSATLGENALGYIEYVCENYSKDVTPEQVAVIIFKESSGYHHKADDGLMEMTQIAVDEVNRIHPNDPEIQKLDPKNPRDNIKLGVLFYQICLDRRDDDIQKAFKLYNSSARAQEYSEHAIALHNSLVENPLAFSAIKDGLILSDKENESIVLACANGVQGGS